jgi:hypothetical protein
MEGRDGVFLSLPLSPHEKLLLTSPLSTATGDESVQSVLDSADSKAERMRIRAFSIIEAKRRSPVNPR